MLDDNSLLIGLFSLVCLVVGSLVFMKNRKPPTVLPQKDFEEFPLIRKEIVSHDTRKFTFGLPAGHVMGLPTGQHLSLRFKDPSDGKMVQRSYTPVTDNSSIGEVSFVIKVYKAGVHPKFPEGGKMSQHLDSLKIGDIIDLKGPKGHMEYLKGGNFTVKPLGKPKESRQTNQIIMMAGGTGITPMLQILHFIFKNPGDAGIKVNLLYANQCKSVQSMFYLSCRLTRTNNCSIPIFNLPNLQLIYSRE
jgi:cytochrome-b5 reductase